MRTLLRISSLSTGIFCFSLFLAIQGCAPAIAPGIRQDTNFGLTFQKVMSNPDLFQDKKILWGGKVISTKYLKNGTLIEILQMPLAYLDKPKADLSLSKGRFLILSPLILDSKVYKKGKSITVAGIIKGTRVKAMDEFKYSYPLIEPLEIKLLKPSSEYSSYYDDPSFYDPFFYDPYFENGLSSM